MSSRLESGSFTVVVLAKAPVPGRVKTRLTPPCTPEHAARIADAALHDTVAAARASRAGRVVVALDDPDRWRVPGAEVVAQLGGGLDQRIAAVFASAVGPTVLVGMDTPQVVASLLDAAAAPLCTGRADATLGLAEDGGFWAVGLRAPDPRPFLGVPMSTATTGVAQRQRLVAGGLAVVDLPALRDVDDWDDVLAVAAQVPRTRFAAAVGSVRAELTVRR